MLVFIGDRRRGSRLEAWRQHPALAVLPRALRVLWCRDQQVVRAAWGQQELQRSVWDSLEGGWVLCGALMSPESRTERASFLLRPTRSTSLCLSIKAGPWGGRTHRLSCLAHMPWLASSTSCRPASGPLLSACSSSWGTGRRGLLAQPSRPPQAPLAQAGVRPTLLTPSEWA